LNGVTAVQQELTIEPIVQQELNGATTVQQELTVETIVQHEV
jgi:hypothetical protein